jgi:magnesium transporter
MKLFKKRSDRAGLPPGTLMPVSEKKAEKTRISVFHYDKDLFEEKEIQKEDLSTYKDSSGIAWININGLAQTEVLESIGNLFDIHSLVLEDILNTHQRPKVEDHDQYIFIVLKMISYSQKTLDIESEQVSFIIKKGLVISFQEREGAVFDAIRNRIRTGKGRIRKMDSDYLAYALMDAIIDNYFLIMEQIGNHIESLEDEIVSKTDTDTSVKIHDIRRKVILLRRSIWPLREVINSLLHTESGLIKKTTLPFIRDLHDHTIQVIEALETFRDILSGLLDIHLSSVSNKMNEVMKVLTIIATLFIPLSFIAGVYGMNFKYMPELELPWAYPAVLGVMAAVIVGFLGYFKYRKWI